MSLSKRAHGLSTFRLVLMRVPFVLTGVLFSITAWSTLLNHWGTFEPTEGVAYAFWGALSLIAVIGIRFPVKMLPILLLQFGYKLIWILAVGYPLYTRGELDADAEALFRANAIGVGLDLIAIPWFYAINEYVFEAFRRRDDLEL